jgi:hypothetical protein
LGDRVLRFAGHWLVDTYTARDRRNLGSCLAIDRQKAMEITTLSFFVKVCSKPKSFRSLKQIVT